MQGEIARPGPAFPAVSRTPSLVYASSLTIAILLLAASLVGLLYSETVYPAAELRRLSVANDLVNLLLVLPFLLGSIWMARADRLMGLLIWPGALLVVFYNSMAAVVSLPVNVSFLLNLLLLPLSAYTVIALLATIDAREVSKRLAGKVPERVVGGVLLVWGVLFALLVFSALVDPLINGTPVPAGDRAVHVADLLIVPALILGGLLLWRRQALGYVAGAGLLFQVNMLFVGLIALLLLQPLLSSEPLAVGDIVITLAMWLIGLIPFLLCIRGIWAREA